MKNKSFLKREQILIVFFLFLLLSNCLLFAQSTEANFLLLSPSPAITGMGGAGTAIPTDDPYNFFYNPAQLGLRDSNTNLSIGLYPSSVDVSPFTEVLFDNYSIQGGYDFSKLLGGFPLSVGAGFLYQGNDLGDFLRTDENGVVIGKYSSKEKAATFSLGFGLDYFIRIAGGISYKLLWNKSDFISGSNPYSVISGIKGNADAFDLGILAEVPIIESMSLGEKFNLNFSASAGYTFANWGSDMVYNEEYSSFAGKTPRTARLGYGLRAGIDYKYKETDYKLVQVDWTSEANDLLIKTVEKIYPPDTVYTLGYKSPLGDINFWDNVIMLRNTSTSVVNRHGVKFSLFETADISFGRYGLPGSNNKLLGSTLGFSISSKGVMKFLSQEMKNDIIEFITRHISLQYSYSRIKFDVRKDEYGSTYRYPEQTYNALYLNISQLW